MAEDEQEEIVQVDRNSELLDYESMYSGDDEIEHYRAIIPYTFQYEALLKVLGGGLSLR